MPDTKSLTGEQRARYDEAVNCGATHNDAMEAALYYGPATEPTPRPKRRTTESADVFAHYCGACGLGYDESHDCELAPADRCATCGVELSEPVQRDDCPIAEEHAKCSASSCSDEMHDHFMTESDWQNGHTEPFPESAVYRNHERVIPMTCSDCGRPTFYDLSTDRYRHSVLPDEGCFLIPAECGYADAIECASARERSVAGISDVIPTCPDHPTIDDHGPGCDGPLNCVCSDEIVR